MYIDYETLVFYFSIATMVVGGLASLTMVFVEVIKKLPVLNLVATELVVVVVAVLLTIISLWVACVILAITVIWYYNIAAVFGGIIVSYVAMFGWEKLINIFVKFTPPKN